MSGVINFVILAFASAISSKSKDILFSDIFSLFSFLVKYSPKLSLSVHVQSCHANLSFKLSSSFLASPNVISLLSLPSLICFSKLLTISALLSSSSLPKATCTLLILELTDSGNLSPASSIKPAPVYNSCNKLKSLELSSWLSISKPAISYNLSAVFVLNKLSHKSKLPPIKDFSGIQSGLKLSSCSESTNCLSKSLLTSANVFSPLIPYSVNNLTASLFSPNLVWNSLFHQSVYSCWANLKPSSLRVSYLSPISVHLSLLKSLILFFISVVIDENLGSSATAVFTVLAYASSKSCLVSRSLNSGIFSFKYASTSGFIFVIFIKSSVDNSSSPLLYKSSFSCLAAMILAIACFLFSSMFWSSSLSPLS